MGYLELTMGTNTDDFCSVLIVDSVYKRTFFMVAKQVLLGNKFRQILY